MNANMSPQAVHGGICVKHLTDAISRTIRITPRMMRTALQWGSLSPRKRRYTSHATIRTRECGDHQGHKYHRYDDPRIQWNKPRATDPSQQGQALATRIFTAGITRTRATTVPTATNRTVDGDGC